MDCISEGARNIVAVAAKTTISVSIENVIVPFDFSKSPFLSSSCVVPETNASLTDLYVPLYREL